MHATLAAEIHTRTTQLLAQAVTAPAQPLPTLSASQLAAYIDHTLLKPEAGEAAIRQLCQEARTFGFASVCVNPTWVDLCSELLTGSPVKTCTVIGFPLGATLTHCKAQETTAVIELGAQEVDMVINVGRLKDQQYAWVAADIAAVVAAAKPHGVPVKVIIETFLLTDAEKIAASILTEQADADFVKTATGFNGGGATVADLRLMRSAVRPDMGLKAAGGIRTSRDALQMIAAGATRLGASAGVKIIQSLNEVAQAGVAAGTTPASPGEPY
ncbi:MAG: deoxyribose-phosphate aldolase [Caldilineaceae bacterium]|nr:deoxyribose-phosphate aldolase [Caldilineaceae bacterium]